MSNPVAIPRSASSLSLSSTASSPGVYVPVHKRHEPSASTSLRSSSPTPSSGSESWREHKPSKASSSAFRNKKQHRKTPSDASSHHSHDNSTHIPKHNMIPERAALPNTYSINTLLTLSSAPAVLAPEHLASLQSLTAYTAPAPAPGSPQPSDKPARRRRTGRQGKKAQQLPAVALQTDVETRRKRHGTWGWQPHTSVEALHSHQHDLETSWRHAPQAVAAAA